MKKLKKRLWHRLEALLKKRLWQTCFPVNFVKFLRTPFSETTPRRLLLMIMWTILNSKSSASGCCLVFAWFFANFSLVLLIKVFFIKKRVYAVYVVQASKEETMITRSLRKYNLKSFFWICLKPILNSVMSVYLW